MSVEVRALDPTDFEAAIPALGALILDAVEGGAGVNFVAAATLEDAAAWWAARTSMVRDGTITAFAAFETAPEHAGSSVIGSAILVRSRSQNAPHRAEVGKVIVHRAARGRGVARGLMAAVEDAARAEGRWLLLLDTVAGSDADAMYRHLGWTAFGTVPDHALRPDGTPAATTYFYRDLR